VAEQNLIQAIADQFRDKHTITVATGITCAYLGDERNLREYLLADSLVKTLKSAGHIVHFLCFNDDYDPLTYRQLRVAVDKNPALVARYEPSCGRPICDIKAPDDSPRSWSDHFADAFQARLRSLDCHPQIINVSRLYSRGLYAPYVRQVLVNEERIRKYLSNNFSGYRPEKLFWAVCPVCGYIDGTTLQNTTDSGVRVACSKCCQESFVNYEDLRGKLNWKLDCAARWAMFKVDAEPFSKQYLEPNTGSYSIASGISRTFFGGSEVVPIQFGSVFMSSALGGKILRSLPAPVVRSLFVNHPKSDLDITEERVVTEANKVEVLPDMTFAELVKQILPAWILDSSELSQEQRELMSRGIEYSKNFERREVRPNLPNRADLEEVPLDVLQQIQGIVQQVILMREAFGLDYTSFVGPAKAAIERLGSNRKTVTKHFRNIIGQQQGVPNSRFLFLLPTSYLKNLESLIDLYLCANRATAQFAVVEQIVEENHSMPLRVVSGDRFVVEG